MIWTHTLVELRYKSERTLGDRSRLFHVLSTLFFLFLGKSVSGNGIQADDRLSGPRNT